MNEGPELTNPGAWPISARLIARWIDRRERLDALLETLPKTLTGVARARCQHLVLGVIRHFGRLDAALGRLIAHPPRFETRGALLVAGYELIEAANDRTATDQGLAAKIVHHAVEQTKTLASPAEARLVNAVGRKLAAALASPPPRPDASPSELAEYFSHPEWLIRNWNAQFGPDRTRQLLEWNQRPAPVHARWRAPAEPVPGFLKPTPWPGYHAVESGHWPEIEALLQAGKIYLQDPATRLPVDLLEPKAGEQLIDLCAAPGGKSLLIADAVAGEKGAPETRLVSVDLPGMRIERLKENLSRVTSVNAALVQADLLDNLGAVLREHRLPAAYDGVLIDAPCSNTGVMRHRVDVKWRLEPGDLKKHPAQQLALLKAAARLVGPNGRLVYATCSIDTEENEYVVREFLASRAGKDFTLDGNVLSMPWETGHDGGAAFRLKRT